MGGAGAHPQAPGRGLRRRRARQRADRHPGHSAASSACSSSASAPSREFQFLRTFLVREVQDNRASVTILVQNEAGKAGQLTPNPTEEIIPRFPTPLDLTNKLVDTKDKPFNLNEYDLIVAFDPDWSEITRDQADMLQTWVQRQGGGLIYVADRINTFQLIRRGTENGQPRSTRSWTSSR